MLHTRSLALLLRRQRKLEKRIRSLEQAPHRSWRVVNLLFVHFHADVSVENTATSEKMVARTSFARCSIWRLGTGTSVSTFGFFLQPDSFQLESHCSRDAVLWRRLHHRLRLIEWFFVQLLARRQLNTLCSIVLVTDHLYSRLRCITALLLFWCFCHLLHISC